MMKKGIYWIIALALLCGFSFPCAAQIIPAPGDADNDIYAKYTSELIGCYTGKSAGGSASVTTDSGITITVTGLTSDLTLVVMPVLENDTEAWSWVSGIMTDRAETFMPFDIYFTDDSGTPVTPGSNVSVTVSVPDSYANPGVYILFPNENISKPGISTTGKTLTFTYTGSGYIVLASAKSGTSDGKPGDPNDPGKPDSPADSSDPDNQGKPDSPDDPGTGDDRNIMLWVFICSASLLGLGGLTAARRNRKRYQPASDADAKGTQ